MRTPRPTFFGPPSDDSLCLLERRDPCPVAASTDTGTDSAAGKAPSIVDEARGTGVFGPMRGRSTAMLDLYQQILRVAPTEATVLLAGETGTGKEFAARTIHDLSKRRAGPFVALNCGAVSTSLVESELFGHEQGSFTGANRRHNGVFAQAEGGTLFLDEITEMPMELQVRLLRVLENGVFHRVGGEKSVSTDVRLIAAANRVPEQAVREGRLRADLFYRLRVFPIVLPPLRCRAGDVELLARHFLDQLNREQASGKQFATRTLACIQAHDWPGNVRELRNFVHQAYILADHELDAEALPSRTHTAAGGDGGPIEIRVGSSIAAVEKQLILATMASLGGNKLAAAKMLGISLKTLYVRLSVYEATELASA